MIKKKNFQLLILNLAVVECLISHGADIHALDDRALKFAGINGRTDIVELLIKYGCDVFII
jgi:ankyrin repeat protein